MSSSSRRTVTIVTGNSRVGKAAIESLLRDHTGVVRVRAVVRDLSMAGSLADLQGDELELVQGGDAFREETHEVAFHGATKAFIVAPQIQNRDEAVNRLIDGAKEYGCGHVVLVGGVFQEEEKFVFHRQWMNSRRHAEAVGVTWTQLECVDFMENVYRCQRDIVDSSKMVVPSADSASPAVALDDIGAAAAAVLASDSPEHDNRAYRMAGPQPITARHMADVLSKHLMKRIELDSISLEASKQLARETGQWQLWQLEGFYDWLRIYFASGRMEAVRSDLPLLNVQPRSFEEWLKTHVDFFAPINREEHTLEFSKK